MKPALCLAVMSLAACALDVPPPVAQGTLTLGGQDYPIISRGDRWFVQTGEGLVLCRAGTQQDCYWSLRAHLLTQATPDDLG